MKVLVSYKIKAVTIGATRHISSEVTYSRTKVPAILAGTLRVDLIRVLS